MEGSLLSNSLTEKINSCFTIVALWTAADGNLPGEADEKLNSSGWDLHGVKVVFA